MRVGCAMRVRCGGARGAWGAGGSGGQDEAAGGDAGAGSDQDRAVAGDLVDRGTADLADRLGDAVHAVDVGLAELAAVRVDRQAAAQLDRAAGGEGPCLAAPPAAEP